MVTRVPSLRTANKKNWFTPPIYYHFQDFIHDVDREKNEVCSGGFAGEFRKSLYLHNVYRDKMKFVLVAAGLLFIVNYVRKSPGLQQ